MQAMAAIERDHESVMKRWAEFKTAGLAALNHQLRDGKLPEIHIESDVHHDEPQADEE
jgi:hypothetical protein